MSLTIHLPKEAEQRLKEHAERSGVDATAFATRLIEHGLRVADASIAKKSWAEIFAPFAEAVAESGLTDEQFDALIEEARDEVYREKSKQP